VFAGVLILNLLWLELMVWIQGRMFMLDKPTDLLVVALIQGLKPAGCL